MSKSNVRNQENFCMFHLHFCSQDLLCTSVRAEYFCLETYSLKPAGNYTKLFNTITKDNDDYKQNFHSSISRKKKKVLGRILLIKIALSKLHPLELYFSSN